MYRLFTLALALYAASAVISQPTDEFFDDPGMMGLPGLYRPDKMGRRGGLSTQPLLPCSNNKLLLADPNVLDRLAVPASCAVQSAAAPIVAPPRTVLAGRRTITAVPRHVVVRTGQRAFEPATRPIAAPYPKPALSLTQRGHLFPKTEKLLAQRQHLNKAQFKEQLLESVHSVMKEMAENGDSLAEVLDSSQIKSPKKADTDNSTMTSSTASIAEQEEFDAIDFSSLTPLADEQQEEYEWINGEEAGELAAELDLLTGSDTAEEPIPPQPVSRFGYFRRTRQVPAPKMEETGEEPNIVSTTLHLSEEEDEASAAWEKLDALRLKDSVELDKTARGLDPNLVRSPERSNAASSPNVPVGDLVDLESQISVDELPRRGRSTNPLWRTFLSSARSVSANSRRSIEEEDSSDGKVSENICADTCDPAIAAKCAKTSCEPELEW